VTPFLADDLKRDEGCRLTAYPDPLTKASPYTIGYGHTGLDVFPGVTWSQEKCEQALGDDIKHACDMLDKYLPWWRSLNDDRQDVLVNMTFNLGIGYPPDGKSAGAGLLSFANTLKAIRRGSYATAAANMRASRWATQVKGRAERLARQMETGVREEIHHEA